MTGESKKDTEPWVERHGMRYSYAYEKSGRLFDELDLDGYPSAVLVSPGGKVVWTGHPEQLSVEMLRPYLANASTTPVALTMLARKLPAAQPIVDALGADRLGEALALADKLAAEDASNGEAVAVTQRTVQGKLEGLEAQRTQGDHYGAMTRAAAAEISLAGRPEAKAFGDLARAIAADKSVKVMLEAQRQLSKLGEAAAKTSKPKEIETLRAKILTLGHKHPNTFVGRSAERMASDLLQRIRGGGK